MHYRLTKIGQGIALLSTTAYVGRCTHRRVRTAQSLSVARRRPTVAERATRMHTWDWTRKDRVTATRGEHLIVPGTPTGASPVISPALAFPTDVTSSTPQRATGLLYERITGLVLASFFTVHREVGFGFAEGVYSKAMAIELSSRGLSLQTEACLPVYYKGVKVGQYAAELLIEGKVAVAVRTGRNLNDLDEQQLHNTLRASRCPVGMLLVFGPKPRFRRLLAWNALRGVPAPADTARAGDAELPSGGEVQ